MALQHLRESRGWTQRRLSAESGIPADVISTIETGRVKNPTWRTVRALAAALEVEPDALFTDASVAPERASA
jgi:transcriptional regulator with XRE-family HTH domain